MITLLPAGPLGGLSVVMTGKLSTTAMVNVAALLDTPLTTTVTLVAPPEMVGTRATICDALHDVTVASVVPKRTTLVPCVVPKLLP